MTKPCGCLVALALLAGCGESGEDTKSSENDSTWRATLAEVEQRAAELDIPGVAVAIVIDGHLAYRGGVGVRGRHSNGPVTGDTLFRSSSAGTKPAIAVALLDLAEEGRVDLHAPVGSIVPQIQFDPQYAAELDLDTLLLQRGDVECCEYRTQCSGTEGVLSYFESRGMIPSVAPPGAFWDYTATGAVAGAAVLETVEDKSFTQVLRERVLDPAGMSSATFDAQEAVGREHAVGIEQGIDVELDSVPACEEHVASSGLFASATDHARLLELLLTPGKVLEQDSLTALQGVEHNPGFGKLWSYGYQAYGLEYKGVRVFHHYGMSEGFTSGMSWVPERRFGVVVLANRGDGYRILYAMEELRFSIVERFLGLSGDPPDNSTPPSTWTKYSGTYVDPKAPTVSFVVAPDGGQLAVSIEGAQATPVVVKLTQGTIDAPYEGGDVFNFIEGSHYFLAAFSPDDTGEMHYMVVYSSAAGHLIAQRSDAD